MATTTDTAYLDVNGLRISVSGDWPEVIEALRRDFAWYPGTSEAPDEVIEIACRRPEPGRFGPLPAISVTERVTVYGAGERTVSDFRGDALLVVDADGRRALVEGEDGFLVWRVAHEHLLARIAAHFERVGLLRVHGLGLVGTRGAVLLVLPPGGGKTTLALRALREGSASLLSDESPLLDGSGRLHPYPLPLRVRPGEDADRLPVEHTRSLVGIDPDPATLELSGFRSRVAPVATLRHVVLGERTLASTAALGHLPRAALARPLGHAVVAGYGLPRSTRGTLDPTRTPTIARRAARAARVLVRAQGWRLTLGTDHDANWDALARLLT